MSFLLAKFPSHLSLDVNAENHKAIKFYTHMGLIASEAYMEMERSGFIKFETPYPGFVIQERVICDVTLETSRERGYSDAATSYADAGARGGELALKLLQQGIAHGEEQASVLAVHPDIKDEREENEEKKIEII